MNGTRVLCLAQPTCQIVEGIEVIPRINPDAGHLLQVVVWPQARLNQYAGGAGHDRLMIELAVLAHKVDTGIVIHHLLVDLMARFYSDAQARRHHRVRLTWNAIHFDAHEGASLDNIIHRLDDLDIGVEINAAMMVENPEAGIVAHKRVFPGLIGLGCIWNAVDIEVVLVPLLDLVIRKELALTLDALDGAPRQRIAAKPAIMYRLRNHLYSY